MSLKRTLAWKPQKQMPWKAHHWILAIPRSKGDSTRTEDGDEHGPCTLTQRIKNGITRSQQEQGKDPLLNSPSEGSKKRTNWSDDETELLLAAVASEKRTAEKRLNSERFWEDVAKGVAGRTGKKCRLRIETLKESYNAVKEYCDKEGKEFAELKEADFEKMKLASWITEGWYNQIRDHCPPRPTKRSRTRGPGSCPTSGTTLSNRGAVDDRRSSPAPVEPHPEVPRACSDVDDKIFVYEHSGVTFIQYPWRRGCE